MQSPIHQYTGGALIKWLRRYVYCRFAHPLAQPQSQTFTVLASVLHAMETTNKHTAFIATYFRFALIFFFSFFGIRFIPVRVNFGMRDDVRHFQAGVKPTDSDFDRVRLSARVFTLQRCSQSVIWCELINWLKSKNHSSAHNFVATRWYTARAQSTLLTHLQCRLCASPNRKTTQNEHTESHLKCEI